MRYGELSYYPPYIYNYALGWFGRDVENLNRIAPQQQAEKIVQGFGGIDAVKKEVEQSITNDELGWAAVPGGGVDLARRSARPDRQGIRL